MTAGWDTPLGRAREDLRAARVLLDSGFPSQAVSHAGSASIQAARGALAALDETPGSASAVVAAFGRRIVGRHGVGQEHGRALRKAFDDRNAVEQGLLRAPAEEALRAIESAEGVVDACAGIVEKKARRAAS